MISSVDRPFLEEEVTVVCLGTKAEERYEHATPQLPNNVVQNVHLKKTTYVLPWALYTISLTTIDDTLPQRRVSDEGMDLIADSIREMIRPE